jgi:ankyrin repeat protein
MIAIDGLKGSAFKCTVEVAIANEDLAASVGRYHSDGENSTFVMMDRLRTRLFESVRQKVRVNYAFDFECENALSRMSDQGDEFTMQLLLDARVDVSDTGIAEGLIRAVRRGHKSITEKLVKNGTKLDERDQEGRTPLSWAAGNGFTDIAKCLIDGGAFLETCDAIWSPPSHLLNSNAELSGVATLFNMYDDVALRYPKGWTALRWAVEGNQQETAILIIENGADVLGKDLWGSCSLSAAIAKRQEPILRAMIQYNKEACKKARLWYHWTALHIAAAHRSLSVMKLLLPDAADVTLRNEFDCTAIELASIGLQALGWPGSASETASVADAIKLLHAHGSSLGQGGSTRRTPLHCAASFGQVEAAEALLECGADVDAKDAGGWTPLMGASAECHASVARLLLSKGADVSAVENKGRTALALARDNGHVELVELLVEAGANNGTLQE